MAGSSPAAQMLGLMGQGDLTADEQKKRQREQAKQGNPLSQMVEKYGQAARDLLSIGGDAKSTLMDNPSAAAAALAPKKRK